MKMIGRMSMLLAILATLVVVGAVPALAKMPPFELEVTVQGDTALIRVSFPVDSSDGFHPTDLDGLLAVYPSNDLDEMLRPLIHNNSIPVDLDWVDEFGWYEGRLQIEEAGSWVVVPFPTSVRFDPDFVSHREYPTPVGFEIPADSDFDALLVGGALTVFTLGGALLLRRRVAAVEHPWSRADSEPVGL